MSGLKKQLTGSVLSCRSCWLSSQSSLNNSFAERLQIRLILYLTTLSGPATSSYERGKKKVVTLDRHGRCCSIVSLLPPSIPAPPRVQSGVRLEDESPPLLFLVGR